MADTPIREKLAEAKRYCLLSVDLDLVETEIKHAIEGKTERIAGPANVFLENINAAITTATIPYTFAKTSILSKLFQQLLSRHRLLALSDSWTVENMDRDLTADEEASQGKVAHENALKEFHDHVNDRLRKEQLTGEMCDYLLDTLQNEQMKIAAEELLRQAAVMIWGAFEVLCKDTLKGQDLQKHLRNPKLWLLQQRRHLIVHRRGVVDKQYLEKTGEKLIVGEQLLPTPAEIEEYFKDACDAALALAKATN